MKKTLLFLFLSLVMIGCKDDNSNSESQRQETEISEKKEQECLDLEEYYGLQSIPDKAEWLRKYGKGVCIDTIYKSAKKTHTLFESDFTRVSDEEGLKITWREIDSLIKGYSIYSRYVSFEFDSVKIKKVITVDKFNDTIPCYSLALFRGIAKENGYNAGISFEFMFAYIKSGKTIIIKVINSDGSISYYDYSDEPKIYGDGRKSPL